jgi:hypothetical protein
VKDECARDVIDWRSDSVQTSQDGHQSHPNEEKEGECVAAGEWLRNLPSLFCFFLSLFFAIFNYSWNATVETDAPYMKRVSHVC